ncbi:MAG: hypothetical protein ACREMH_08485 [Gemmatimonadales bacterium]
MTILLAMRQRAGLQLRRILAVATALALLGSVAETPLPEIHDGVVEAMSTQNLGTPTPDQPTRAPNHSPDSPHVCHCLHAHLAAPSPGHLVAQPSASHPAVPAFHRRSPPASPAAYHFRPPIA